MLFRGSGGGCGYAGKGDEPRGRPWQKPRSPHPALGGIWSGWRSLGATAGWLPALLSFQTIRAVSSSAGFLENTALSFGSESGYSAWLSPLHGTARLLAPTDVSPSDFSTQTFAEHLLCARYHVHIIISFHSNLRKEVVISAPFY